MTIRLLVVTCCLLSASAVVATTSRPERVPPRESFAAFPLEVGQWTGTRAPEFPEAILRELGVDEYLHASYASAGAPPAGLYIGYYESQRQGDAIHSPANCLPGSGWQPVESAYLTMDVGRPITVNRWLIQKEEEQQLVLYWYQSHGRVVASEYASKVHLVFDAMRLNRTDAALVRVVVPIAAGQSDARAAAERAAVTFVTSLFPHLERFLPL
jgi:EpsI family protein